MMTATVPGITNFLFPTMKPLDLPKKDVGGGAPDAPLAEAQETASADFECACHICPSQEACKAAQEAAKP